MALFAISDLHLSFSTDKPMDVFGHTWQDYEQRMADNWNDTVTDDDTVIIAGDVSWATYLENADLDFEYIHKLKGKKIILKGNHDYWWTTLSKLNTFCREKGFDSISFLQNNSYNIDGVSLCGTRGWLPYSTCVTVEDKKIYKREIERFVLSIKNAGEGYRIAALHYPPDQGFINIMKEHNIHCCVFGHLHAKAQKSAQQGSIDGIDFKLISCDYLGFTPQYINIPED